MLITLICFILLIMGFVFQNVLIDATNETIAIFIKSIFPTLFFFMVICDILMGLSFVKKIGEFLSRPLKYIFKYESSTSYLLVLISSLIGNIALAKSVNDLVSRQEINVDEGNELIYFHSGMTISFTLFITRLLYPFDIALKIILAIFIGRIILVFVFKIIQKVPKIDLAKPKGEQPVYQLFFQSIDKNIIICLSILGIMIIASIIRMILIPIIPEFFFPFIEITSGLVFSNNLSPIICVFALCSMGVAVSLQIKKVYPALRYTNFIYYRLIHGFLAAIIFYLINFI